MPEATDSSGVVNNCVQWSRIVDTVIGVSVGECEVVDMHSCENQVVWSRKEEFTPPAAFP